MSGLNPTAAGALRLPRRGKTLFTALWNPVGDGGRPGGPQHPLGWPLSCRRRQRILVTTTPDLFDDSRPEATLDLVHAVIAVAYRHCFLVVSAQVERIGAYYRDAATPQRIAEEIDALSLASLAAGRKVPRDWIAGFSRVRYGLSRKHGRQIGPIGLEPWPLPNLWLDVPIGGARRIVALAELLDMPPASAADRAAPA
jgi:hypothetical protein